MEKGEVKFRTIHFRPTAVVQHSYIEFPYKDWSIETLGLHQALVTIEGKLNKIQILVNEGDCELVEPLNTEYMRDTFQGKKMSPSLLLLVFFYSIVNHCRIFLLSA